MLLKNDNWVKPNQLSIDGNHFIATSYKLNYLKCIGKA
jgi:hypothetical protein